MSWFEALSTIEDLEDAEFDRALVDSFEARANGGEARPIRFSTPTFKEYSSTELDGCGQNSFPAFSITAAACGLNCDHCQKKILEPMILIVMAVFVGFIVVALFLPLMKIMSTLNQP